MNAPLEELYLDWLYSQVAPTRLKNPQRTYWSLLRQLHTTEFVAYLRMDANRVADGKELRNDFLREMGLERGDVDPLWLDEGCSMLELLLVLARILSFEAGGEVRDWYWHMIDVLGIRVNDRHYTPITQQEIADVLHRLINRNYAPNGQGGIFPLRQPTHDQRTVELWYQLSAYVLEMN